MTTSPALSLNNKVINIRGTSGSGKSTLIKWLLEEFEHVPVMLQVGPWKKPRIGGYLIYPPSDSSAAPTFLVGSYETKCGGCDSMSYKGSMDDIEALVREGVEKGYNVIFEGLVVTSVINRWRTVANDYPRRWVWMFMVTPEEECHRRIVARNGREPKRHGPRQLADYNIKYAASMNHYARLEAEGEHPLPVLSDAEGYGQLKYQLGYS